MHLSLVTLTALPDATDAVADNPVTDAVQDTVFQLFGKFLETGWGRVAVAILLAVVTVVVAKLVSHAMLGLAGRQRDKGIATVIAFSRYFVLFMVYFIGVTTITSLFPTLSSSVSKIFAGAGVIAVVAGLASQEALGRIVGGVMILVCKPFVIGDVIRYMDGNVVGTVEDITLNHTVIRTGENKRVIVPNNKAGGAVIENANYKDSMVCVYLDVTLAVEADVAQARQCITRAVLAHPLFLDRRSDAQKRENAEAVAVRVEGITEKGIALRAYVWTARTSDAGKLKSDLLEEIQRAFLKQGVAFAVSATIGSSAGAK